MFDISLPTKEQWVSIVKNAAITGLVSFALSLQVSNELTSAALSAAFMAAGVAIAKTVEKLLTAPRLG